MIKLFAFLAAVLIGFAGVRLSPVVDATPCVNTCPAGQPHPDIFQYPGIANMQTLNPINQKAVGPGHTVAYRLVTMPGCITGNIPQAMTRVEQDFQKVNFTLVHNDTLSDFTITIKCGQAQINDCGAVNIFCLPNGFPYHIEISLSDILSTYTAESQLSIPEHELMHALATWNEQYCLGTEGAGNPCQGIGQFGPTPGWPDIMNTGPDSRHGITVLEQRRWADTMYPLATAQYQNCQSYPGWGTTVSCYWPALGKWLWLIPTSTGDQLWEFADSNPKWVCTVGCPR